METSPKRKLGGLRTVEIMGLIAFVLCLLFFLRAAREWIIPSRPDLTRIAEVTGIKFPSGSKVISSYLDGPTTRLLLAKVQVRKSDVPRFLKSIKKDPTVSKEKVKEVMEDYAGHITKEWDPSSVRNYDAFVVDEPDHHRCILIDWDRSLIYLYKMAK